jgi:hypothetical protein
MEGADEVADCIATAGKPLTIPEITSITGVPQTEVDQILWGSPGRFVWQPGHRWGVATLKSRPKGGLPKDVVDTRLKPFVPELPKELRAITLESGVTIRVRRRPLDTDAFFSVKTAGNGVELVINSSHEMFGVLPMPFDSEGGDSPYRALTEVLLAGWALYEDGAAGGSASRAMEDARLLWGRRVIEILHESE